ncbi:MAG: ABC transporter permease [Synergistaceae bacterium]|nr:ABC transporter permease [Synergistaceae bacterium]
MTVKGYWTRRLGGAACVVAIVLVANFFLFRLMPGDPVSTVLDPRFSPEAKAKLEALYGLDRPLGVQFFIYLRRMTTFDFGLSFATQRPVLDEILERLPNTLALLVPAYLLSVLLGTVLGVLAARRRGRVAEKAVLAAGAVSFSFPSFFVQMVLLLLFAYVFPVFPLRGSLSIPPPQGAWPLLADRAWHLALPVLSLVLLGFGGWALTVRNLVVKVMGEDFMVLARAKGIGQRRLFWGHALRAVLPPLLTLFLLSLPGVVSGAVLTETVFSLHGVGRFLLESVLGQDYPAAGAAFYLLTLITVGSNLLADFLVQLVDPRIRTGGEGS